MNERQDIREQLSAYLDGELAEEAVRQVEAALARDASLRTELEQLRSARRLLHALPRHHVPARFASRVLAQAERRRRMGAFGGRYRIVRWVTVGATAAVVLIAAGVMLYLTARPSGEGVPGGGPSGVAYDSRGEIARADRSSGTAAEGHAGLGTGADSPGGPPAAAGTEPKSSGPAGPELAKVPEAGPCKCLPPEGPRKEAVEEVAERPDGLTETPGGGKAGKDEAPSPADAGKPGPASGESLAVLAAVDVYTHDLPRAQRDLEKLLVANSISPVVLEERSGGTAAADAQDNLGRQSFYNVEQAAAGQVRYVFVVARDQAPDLKAQLDRFRAGQKVSQVAVGQIVSQTRTQTGEKTDTLRQLNRLVDEVCNQQLALTGAEGYAGTPGQRAPAAEPRASQPARPAETEHPTVDDKAATRPATQTGASRAREAQQLIGADLVPMVVTLNYRALDVAASAPATTMEVRAKDDESK